MKKIVLIFITFLGVQLFANNIDIQLTTLAHKWSLFNSQKNTVALARLYSESIIYYGSNYKKSMCLKDKQRIFAKYPNFSQKIDHLSFKEYSDGVYKISFDKYVKIDNSGKVKIYPSYLIAKFYGANLFIIEEGDKVTDANLAKRYLSKKKSEQKNSSIINFNINKTQIGVYQNLKNCEPYQERQICSCFVNFSNPKIKPISLGKCINVDIKNQGDLNDDGADEIGVIANSPEGCWRDYHIYSIGGFNAKKLLTIPIYVCAINSIYTVDLVKKDPKRKGYVFYRYFGMDVNDNIDFSGKKWVSGKLK